MANHQEPTFTEEDVKAAAQAMYEAEDWSGCAGSGWDRLLPETRAHWMRLARRALTATAPAIAARAQQPVQAEMDGHDKVQVRERGLLWTALDWTFWGVGMADVIREPLADKMIATLTDDEWQHATALIHQGDYVRGGPAARNYYEELKADNETLRTQLDKHRATLGKVTALTFASDGSEYEHDHGVGDGHDQCPACWAEDLRAILDIDPATILADVWNEGVTTTLKFAVRNPDGITLRLDEPNPYDAKAGPDHG